MKYNRQQKYNCYSILKTVVLVLLLCLSLWMLYLYIVIYQKNSAIVNTIESQKNQISDLEAISKSNKAMLKTLKRNIENQKQNVKRLQNDMNKYSRNSDSEQALMSVRQLQKELEEKINNLNRISNEMKQQNEERNDEEKRIREGMIESLQTKINELRDSISTLKEKENQSPLNIGEKKKDKRKTSFSEKEIITTGKNSSLINRSRLSNSDQLNKSPRKSPTDV